MSEAQDDITGGKPDLDDGQRAVRDWLVYGRGIDPERARNAVRADVGAFPGWISDNATQRAMLRARRFLGEALR